MKFLTKVKKYEDANKVVKRYYFCGVKYLYKKWTSDRRVTRIFGIKVSDKYLDTRKKKINYFAYGSYEAKIKNAAKGKKIDIVIPIYNGYEYLNNLFDSIFNNTDIDYRIIAVNDCSPDLRIRVFLDEQTNKFGKKLLILENKTNQGFVRSVNLALKKCRNNVVLVNTDVVLPINWASRLFYPIFMDENVASVTPFSNAATIFSVPELDKNNKLEVALDEINRAIKQLRCNFQNIKLCTGVGFCMAMNLRVMDKIGLLDEIYDKGYGEENDWCQRAIKYGYYNTICSNLFVWHKHGGSFVSSEKKELMKRNAIILKERYPSFDKQVQDNLKDPAFQFVRFWAELIYLCLCADSSTLWIQHCWGGGAESYLINQKNASSSATLFLILRNSHSSSIFTLEYWFKNKKNKINLYFNDAVAILNSVNLNRLIINNLAGYSNLAEVAKLICDLKENDKCKVCYMVHDFQALCPTIHLLRNDEFCFITENGVSQCVECLKHNKNNLVHSSNIIEYRKFYFDLLNKSVDNIITFSNSSKNIFLKVYPNLSDKISVRPHTISPLSLNKTFIKKDTYIIAILGAIGVLKGSIYLESIDNFLNSSSKLNFKIIGYADRKYKNILQTGQYNRDDLPDIFIREDIDAVFISSIVPETFSYTTSETMSMKLPLICFNLGAQAEHVSKYSLGLVLDSGISVSNFFNEAYNFIDKVFSNH